MKRQKNNYSDDSDDDSDDSLHSLHSLHQLPNDVFNELTELFDHKCMITLTLDYDIPKYRKYKLNLTINDVFSIDMQFAVAIERNSNITFMYGNKNNDEYSYDVNIPYSYNEIQNIPLNIFPPFIHIHGNMLVCNDKNIKCTFKMDSIDSNSLYQFKQEYVKIFKWISNKS